ncbi:MAG: hypothetical protein H7A46_15080 [Verrucomicrobiales bacterium]|nr:hypothetical protein [Verrucomicrobiales bacterium]
MKHLPLRAIRALLLIAILLPGLPLRAGTYVVTSTADSGPGTLREALGSGSDRIEFNLPIQPPVQTIRPLTPLPPLDGVILDGFSQPGSQPNTDAGLADNALRLIRLEGGLIGPGLTPGLQLVGHNNEVRGLVIVGFATGVQLTSCRDSIVAGCSIGLDVDGLPTANTGDGLFLERSVSGDCVRNRIGGPAPADRNIISGNRRGIFLFFGANQNVIQGNLIGTDATGRLPRGNQFQGVMIQSGNDNLIGGSGPGEGNLIGANWSDLELLGDNRTRVQGNHLGTAAAGPAALGAQFDEVVANTSRELTLGGTLPGAGNVIGNGGRHGVSLHGVEDSVVLGNWIGSDGGLPIPNANGGIRLDTCHRVMIGDASEAGANRIWMNLGPGVSIASGAENPVRGNSIWGNRGPGIDLDPSGPTPNDPLDADDGPNRLQNHPDLVGANRVAGSIELTGKLHSTPDRTFALDFHWGPDAGGGFEFAGREWFHSLSVRTDAAGDAPFGFLLPGTDVLPAGGWVTATATDADGNTSEFAPPVWLAATEPPARLQLRLSGQELELRWPAQPGMPAVEFSPALGTGAEWGTAPGSPSVEGTDFLLKLPFINPDGSGFFRLAPGG